MQIFLVSDEVSDMKNKLYPTKVDVQNNKWSSRIKEKFPTVSELECGAHAALVDDTIDYFIYTEDGQCHLGELNHASTASDDITVQDIRIRRGMDVEITKFKYLI